MSDSHIYFFSSVHFGHHRHNGCQMKHGTSKKKKSSAHHLSLLIISRRFLKTMFIERIYLSPAQLPDRDGSQQR